MRTNEITSTEYAEHTDNPTSWKSPRPSFDLDKFNLELLRRCGKIGEQPRFRCVWGGEREEYLIEEAEALVGYDYTVDGITNHVPATEGDFEFPDEAIITPRFDTIKVFTPRFIIEEFRTSGPGSFMYHKAWAVEEVEVLGKHSGRVDLRSHYREPAEIDIQMCENLARTRDTLTHADIVAGVRAQKEQEKKAIAGERDLFIVEVAEETAKALQDGLPNATKYGYNPNLTFDIRKHSENLIREHNENL